MSCGHFQAEEPQEAHMHGSSQSAESFSIGTCASEAMDVVLRPLPPLIELERIWRELEQRSDGSFFVSWSWIGCWLRSINGAVEINLLQACSGTRTVGLALLTRSRERRHLVITSNRLRLHATGRADSDGLHIECNGFLVDRQSVELTTRSMLQHLLVVDHRWDEVILDGLWRAPVWPDDNAAGIKQLKKIVWSKVNHHVDLAEVRRRKGDYLGLLGSKTRSHIRRSRREYQKLGTIRVAAAEDLASALAYLDGMKTLHQRYWVGRGQPGAFANPFFELFHRRLVRDAFMRGEIQLLAIDIDGRKIGYIYNFLYRGRIYNYQTGFDYTVCERQNRPGLVSHACAIEFNAERGHAIYDFLAGDFEYKQALGTHCSAMSWVVLQRPRMRFAIEDALRGLRNHLHVRKATTAESDSGELGAQELSA
jgi:CelD/BcsL family acetyltransferase involved in cellulose biosynthesis